MCWLSPPTVRLFRCTAGKKETACHTESENHKNGLLSISVPCSGVTGVMICSPGHNTCTLSKLIIDMRYCVDGGGALVFEHIVSRNDFETSTFSATRKYSISKINRLV